MGNEMSQEEEAMILEEAYKLSLDNPEIDKKINAGTTAPNCQPKHTIEEHRNSAAAADEDSSSIGDDDHEDDTAKLHHGAHNELEIVLSADSDKASDVEVLHGGQNGAGAKTGKNTSNSSKYGRSQSDVAQNGNATRQHRRRSCQDSAGSQQDDPAKMGYVAMARAGYQELVNAIIRPPRADYKVENLGPPAFIFCGKRFTRTDFTLRTKRGLNLECSHWEPVERTSDRIPVVIYMHGNSSARVEVIPQLSYLLSLGLAVFAFDFAGSGKSDGSHVSLGYYEREDLMCVIAHLRATNVVSTIALWGRSMGAATALMHGDRDPSISCMILDSSFADLTRLCEELVEKGKEQGIHVPGVVTQLAIRLLQNSVRKQANFSIRDISPISHADKCFIPALFVAGEHDDFISKKHSQDIHDRYVGDKNIIIVDGDHNSPRPKFMFDSVSIFLQTCLQIPQSWALKVSPGMNLMAPPWYLPGPSSSSSSGRSSSRGATRSASPAPATMLSGAQRNNEIAVDSLGMTAERQKEIQSSLYKMLGQADDNNSSDPSSSKQQQYQNHRPGISEQSIGDNSNRSRICSTYSVNHSKTFPPQNDADSRKGDEEDDLTEDGTASRNENMPPTNATIQN